MCGIFGWALGAANRQSGETLGDRYRDFFAQDMLNSEARGSRRSGIAPSSAVC